MSASLVAVPVFYLRLRLGEERRGGYWCLVEPVVVGVMLIRRDVVLVHVVALAPLRSCTTIVMTVLVSSEKNAKKLEGK